MASIDKTITVDVPLLVAYVQWTRFEEFSLFMEGVREVRQLDHKRLHWRAVVMGREVDWFAEITQQVPGRCIAWRSLSASRNAGGVSFQSLGPSRTLLTLRMELELAGGTEIPGTVLALVSTRLEGDLRRFKTFIEERDHASRQDHGELRGAPIRQSSAF